MFVIIYFLEKFIFGLSDKQGRRRKNEDRSVPEFEKMPRLSTANLSHENNTNKVDLLPFKGDKGIILRQIDQVKPGQFNSFPQKFKYDHRHML